jgi:hypothetical protein
MNTYNFRINFKFNFWSCYIHYMTVYVCTPIYMSVCFLVSLKEMQLKHIWLGCLDFRHFITIRYFWFWLQNREEGWKINAMTVINHDLPLDNCFNPTLQKYVLFLFWWWCNNQVLEVIILDNFLKT